MSATGRSASAGTGYVRNPDDFFATPEWATRALLRAISPLQRSIVLDPACGAGAILDVALERGLLTNGMELDDRRAVTAASRGHHVIPRDALDHMPWPMHDVIVMNPPFGCAMEFVERALEESKRRGADVAALLRLPWLAGQKRAAFHRAHPSDVYVLPKRPSFTPDGKTDATDYAWLVWGPGRGGRWSVLDLSGAPSTTGSPHAPSLATSSTAPSASAPSATPSCRPAPTSQDDE